MQKFIIPIIAFIYTQTQPTNSDNCLTWNNNAGICEKCLQGYFLEYYFCVPCNRLCHCSSHNDFCLECLPIVEGVVNIRPIIKDNQCEFCNKTIQHCISCSSETKCQQCANGRFLIELDNNDVVCSNQTCGLFCQVCQNEQFCIVCQQGHFLQNGGICKQEKCTDYCLLCQSQNKCETCFEEYFMKNGICYECMQNCTKCTNQTVCLECLGGYNFINGSCLPNQNGLNNCVDYASDFSICLKCQVGYYLSGGGCSQCSGCSICTALFICQTDCFEGFRRFNFACLPKWQPLIKLFFSLVLIVLLIY